MLSGLKRAAIPLAVLGVGIGIVTVLNAFKPQPDTATEPPRALSVYTQQAIKRDAQLQVQVDGEVRAQVRSDVVTQVAGRIIDVSPEFIEGGGLFRQRDAVCYRRY